MMSLALPVISIVGAVALAHLLWRLSGSMPAGDLISFQRVKWVCLFGFGTFCLTALASPRVLLAIWYGYPTDGIFNPSASGIVAVLLVAIFLTIVLFWMATAIVDALVNVKLADWLVTELAVASVGVATVIAVGLSAQVFYELYRVLISDLPAQWVIGQTFDLTALINRLMFIGRETTGEHAHGLAIWATWLLTPLYLAQAASSDKRRQADLRRRASSMTLVLVASMLMLFHLIV